MLDIVFTLELHAITPTGTVDTVICHHIQQHLLHMDPLGEQYRKRLLCYNILS